MGDYPPITEEEIIAFARQWDPQPFHTDPDEAKRSIYGGVIASGWHTGAMAMRLLVDSLISKTHAQGSPGVENIRFRKPVRPGDRLSGRHTILVTEPSASRPTLGKILARTEMLDEGGEVVFQMEGWSFLDRRPTDAD